MQTSTASMMAPFYQQVLVRFPQLRAALQGGGGSQSLLGNLEAVKAVLEALLRDTSGMVPMSTPKPPPPPVPPAKERAGWEQQRQRDREIRRAKLREDTETTAWQEAQRPVGQPARRKPLRPALATSQPVQQGTLPRLVTSPITQRPAVSQPTGQPKPPQPGPLTVPALVTLSPKEATALATPVQSAALEMPIPTSPGQIPQAISDPMAQVLRQTGMFNPMLGAPRAPMPAPSVQPPQPPELPGLLRDTLGSLGQGLESAAGTAAGIAGAPLAGLGALGELLGGTVSGGNLFELLGAIPSGIAALLQALFAGPAAAVAGPVVLPMAVPAAGAALLGPAGMALAAPLQGLGSALGGLLGGLGGGGGG